MSTQFMQNLANRPRQQPQPTVRPPGVNMGGSGRTGQNTQMTFTQTRPASDFSGPTNLDQFGSHTAQATMPQFDQFRSFGDAVRSEYERNAVPEIERRNARLEQDLINKGLTPGSEAYERERDRAMRAQNDLYTAMENSALQQGLAAQQQAFGQSLGQAQVNAGLKQAAMGTDASRYGSFMGAQASMYGSDNNREGALERLLAGLNQQESEFGRSHEQRQGQIDFNNLLGLGGLYGQFAGINNAGLSSDRGFAGGALGQYLPTAPFIPINAGGAYNTALAGDQARANIGMNNYNSTMQGLGSLGSAALMAFSDRNAKTDIDPVDNDEILESVRRIPVSRWRYEDGDRTHIGPMAQDFGREITNEPEAQQYYIMDAIGSLMSSVQAIADRLDKLEAA